jgi:hypothetical protein
MKRLAAGLAMCLAFVGAWAQQVWRCEVDGQVRYTDQPCEKVGAPLPARILQPNGVENPAPTASAASDVPASAPLAESAGSHPLPAVPPRRGARARGAHAARFAMQGLMQTDFVQRGYLPRRQNPASTPTP